MILYNNIVEISKNRWIGYMLKVAFLLASSIFDHNFSVVKAGFFFSNFSKKLKVIHNFFLCKSLR